MSNIELETEFLQQVNAHMRILYKVSAVYFSNAGDREDAVQDILYQLWRAYPNYERRSAFSTWMYRVALNTVLTSRRRSSRQPTLQSDLVMPDRPIVDDNDVQQTRVEWLYSAIRELSEIERAVILLYLEGYSYEEIAVITGLTRSNVSVRIVRIKKALEARLKTVKQSI